MDYGQIFAKVMEDFIVPFFAVEVTFFGVSASVGAIMAWVVIGSVVVAFVRSLGDS